MNKVLEIVLMCFIAADTAREARIVSTCQSSFILGLSGNNQYPASNLLNGKGLNGTFDGDNCAITNFGSTQWISFELEVPQNLLFSIQITPRLDCCPERSRNIHVTIGPSRSYNPREPLCRPMFDLELQKGLTEYKCTGELHQGRLVKSSGKVLRGRFVKISNGLNGSGRILDICEVEIFTVRGNQMLLGVIIQSY